METVETPLDPLILLYSHGAQLMRDTMNMAVHAYVSKVRPYWAAHVTDSGGT